MDKLLLYNKLEYSNKKQLLVADTHIYEAMKAATFPDLLFYAAKNILKSQSYRK